MRIANLFILLTLLVITTSASAQEATRQIEGPGQFDKYLTPGLLDRWIIDGEKGETIIAHVSTRQFDPVLELAVTGEDGKEDTILLTVDDKGSESRFSFRLPEAGEYCVRVHAFEYKGGGNYSLQIRRFVAQPLMIGQPAVGTIDRQGKAYLWLAAKKDQVLRVDPGGESSRNWELLDGKGQRADVWSSSVTVEEDGVYSMIVSGRPASRYELTIREASQRELADDKDMQGQLGRGEMDVWSFDGKPGEFRILTIKRQGHLSARLSYTPREKKDVERVERGAELPEIRFVPVASKGEFIRFAAIFGREGRYQLHVAPDSTASYTLEMRDPTITIAPGDDLTGTLPVGGSAFYKFRAAAGQLLSASLDSEQFDPTLSLYDDRGDRIASNDDGGEGIGSRITHMVVREAEYRLHVASLGSGGGGEYALGFAQRKLNELKINGRGTGTSEPERTDFWTFTGKENQTVLLSVRSTACDPNVSLYSPDGVELASDDNSGAGTDALLAVQLPRTGSYTIWISSNSGAGEYTLRLIDGD